MNSNFKQFQIHFAVIIFKSEFCKQKIGTLEYYPCPPGSHLGVATAPLCFAQSLISTGLGPPPHPPRSNTHPPASLKILLYPAFSG